MGLRPLNLPRLREGFIIFDRRVEIFNSNYLFNNNINHTVDLLKN